jgi:hypothetical protein
MICLIRAVLSDEPQSVHRTGSCRRHFRQLGRPDAAECTLPQTCLALIEGAGISIFFCDAQFAHVPDEYLSQL